MITQAGACIQRTAMPNCSGVSARINANSSTAKAATAIAITEKTRFARAARSLHQTTTCISARIRHIPPPIAQMTVTQFILPEVQSRDEPPDAERRQWQLRSQDQIRRRNHFERGWKLEAIVTHR